MTKKKKQKRGMRPVIYLVILLVLFASLYQGAKLLTLDDKLAAAQERKKFALELYEKEQKRGEELETLKMNRKTKKFIEEVAREKFGLTYKNEIIFEPENE